MSAHDADIAWFAAALARRSGGVAPYRAALYAEEFERLGAERRAEDWRAVEYAACKGTPKAR